MEADALAQRDVTRLCIQCGLFFIAAWRGERAD